MGGIDTAPKPERLPMLSEAEAFDILFWSFLYSQGAPELQRMILNRVRRSHDVPDSFKSMYTEVERQEYIESADRDPVSGTFALPESELPRYREYLGGAHTGNTGGRVPTDAEILEQINGAVGEFVNPEEYNKFPTTELLDRIFQLMLARDFKQVIVKKRRLNSQVVDYIFGSRVPPGPRVFSDLMAELRPVGERLLAAEKNEAEAEIKRGAIVKWEDYFLSSALNDLRAESKSRATNKPPEKLKEEE